MEERQDIQNIFRNGSTWLRADFHLHTKADKEFVYDGDENDFIRLYIEQLKNQNIGLGIVTNHNKFDKGEFVALKKKARKEGIGLFAGVEFSLKEGIHILIIFDDEWYQGETDNITKFLENAFYGIPNYDKPNYPNSNFSLKDTVEALDKIGYEYFIILAHIDDLNGLCVELRGRTLEDFVKQEPFNKVLAVQKSRNLENYNRLCGWTNRKIACVEGSDNAHGGIEAIGNGRVAYVKVGDFNLEALKFALIDLENRVVQKDKPLIKNSYIKSIAFEGGKLNGIQLDLSPELNNLIGIRGSGKSSILEVLRYTLGISLTRTSADSDYKNELIQFILGSGGRSVVTVVNERDEEYRLEKIYGQKENIFDKNGVLQQCSIEAVFKQPIYFGQKDLSNKNTDFESDLMQRLIGNKLKPIQYKIEAKKREVENTILETKKLQSLKTLKDETELTIKNAQQQLKFFKEKGVEEKLKQQTLFDADVVKVEETRKTIKSFYNDIAEIIENYQHLFSQETIIGSEINKEIFENLAVLMDKLKVEFSKLKQINETSNIFLKDIDIIITEIADKKENLKEEFAKIKRELNSDTINPDTFLTLNRQISTSKLKLQEIEKSEKKREELQTALSQHLYDLNNLWLEEYRLLEQEATRINETDNSLQIELGFKEQRSKFIDKLKQTFRGTNIRESTYQQISDSYKDFIEIRNDQTALKNLLNETQLSEFYRRFRENYAELLTFKVENKVVINYNGKSLDKHSLGQRASALILFLLAQKDNDVLIIDQPEDDLDNQTIYEDVIKEIKKSKGNMQFIFATHNANIPVLGDSEKVMSCAFDDNNISVQSGAIDSPQIQKDIVNIMEGGDEAFNRRKNIYSIWNVEKGK
ncbi:MAG TPA: histidinol-phosphatase [Acholeplasmataceae bacterium]|jgi:predicted ATPase|nr:histidinol-phosphatase [Acholeplasmataceae bacterium]